jgi:Fe-S cluster biosynthesis and repair protein YggX
VSKLTSRRLVFCQKFKCKKPALASAPLPGAFGQRIFHHISQEAWGLWLTEQTKLINERRLKTFDINDQKIIRDYCQTFLFSDQ